MCNLPKRSVMTLLLALSLTFTPVLAAANSSPVRLDRDPVFQITPLTDSPLIVANERLTFEVGSSSSEAMVTASYQIINPSDTRLDIPMIFPAVSEGEPLFRPRITLDGQELDYELFLAGSASVMDYFDNPQGFAQQVNVASILSALNQPLYQPQSFRPGDQAVLYEVTLGGQINRQSTIEFEFDPEKTKVVSLFHQGYFGNRTTMGSQVKFSRHVDEMTLGEKMAVLVIGDDDLTGLAVSSGDSLSKRAVTVDQYLREVLFASDTGWRDLDKRNTDNFYSAILQELDASWVENVSSFSAARPLDDVVNNVLYQSNISAFLFTAAFAPDSTTELTVSYPVRATIDRSTSTDFVNTFAYILSPAGNFADFGTLDIEIRLNQHSPYVLESSIPLQTDGTGKYTASLQGLPEVDLVFSTYTRPQITALDSLRANSSYPVLILIIGAAFLLAITALLMLMRRLSGSAQ